MHPFDDKYHLIFDDLYSLPHLTHLWISCCRNYKGRRQWR